jgi:Tol biopolymer transport system component
MKKALSALVLSATALTAGAQSQRQQPQVTSILEVLDVETGERSVVREFQGTIEAPNCTKDGRWLVFNSNGLIYKISADDTGEVQPVNTGHVTRCNNDHVLSADGKYIAVSSAPSSTEYNSLIYKIALDGSTPPQLIVPIGPSYLHGWSPDGRSFAYCAFRDNGNIRDVYVMDAKTGLEKRLTTADDLDDGPEYSPNGRYIWFNSVRSGMMQVWRMRANGKKQKQMTFDETRNAWFPHVSPDGKKVIYLTYHKGDLEPNQHVANKNVELWLMPAKGGQPRKLIDLFGGQGTINVNSWAPDSRHVAFVSYRLN